MAVKRGDRNNGLAVHARDTHHQIDWEKAKVKEVEKYKWKRKILEVIHILQNS